MRYSLPALVAISGIALAQNPAADDPEVALAWLNTSYEARQRQFEQEERDQDWSRAMERAIAEEVASWQRPPVRLVQAECRMTICRIETSWPRTAGRPAMGQQTSFLYGLGIDHQGEFVINEDGSRQQVIQFARRR